MATRVVSARGLGMAYAGEPIEQTILQDVSLDVAAGELVVIFGSSGVGKSTLLRMVCGLVEPSAGTIAVTPHDSYGKSENQSTSGLFQEGESTGPRRQFGFVFQEPRLFPWRTVRANVELGLEGLGMSGELRSRRAHESLSLVGLAEMGDRLPSQLSGGQRQRVGIARALAVRPDVLLMDEPFSSLDAITRQNLQNEVLRIWETTHTAILFVTHDVQEAIYLADRIILLAGSPAKIVSEYLPDMRRPRRADDPEYQNLTRRIAFDLKRYGE